MKKIFWRVFVYFGLVLLLFSVLIGLMFTRFNSTNIVGAYKQQLGDLATGVASRTSKAVSNKENDTFSDYLAAVEDFSDMQNVDIWVVSNEKAKNPLADDFTNVDIAQVTVPEDTRQILESAYQGKKKTYTDYDDIYKNTMLHLAVPIRDAGGNVIGAVVVTGPMEMQENTMTQYEKYMVLCVAVGLFLTLILAVVFSRMLVRPIIKIKEAALVLAAGEYGKKTGVTRRDELGSLAESMDTLSDRLVEAEEYQKAVEQNRRDFFSNVSHELRTPIAVVKGYVDTMADGVVTDEEKKKEFLGRIQRECNGMERLVSDLLILSRMQNPDYQLALEGDANGAGFLDVIEEYGSTPSGNLAKHYAGICYLKTGDLENAAKYLAKYSPVKGIPGALINAQNLGLQGDIAVEQQNYAKAVKFYEQAVKAADNNLTAPMYLRKAGLAEQAQGNNEKAAAFYEQILTSYPASTDAREAEKLLGSVK